MLPMQGAQVQALVWELSSRKLCGEAQNPKTNKQTKQTFIASFQSQTFEICNIMKPRSH